jgi:hypothetical protein
MGKHTGRDDRDSNRIVERQRQLDRASEEIIGLSGTSRHDRKPAERAAIVTKILCSIRSSRRDK